MSVWLKLLFLLVGVSLLLFLYVDWQSGLQYQDEIKIGAVHMKYACGECSLEMKVLSVNDPAYQFILDAEVFPVPAHESEERLCEFVSNANYNTAFNEKDTGLQFNIAGRLHRYKEIFSISGCTAVRCFEVDSIQYGNGEWMRF